MKQLSFFLLFILSMDLFGQQSSFKSISGLPSTEVYDLLKDSKGYLWIGHDLGISRYDGHNFVHFSNPLQNGLSMNNLSEDRQGRIWCSNFGGQIFFTDSFKLKLLTTYRFKEESAFPRIGIYKNELVATSDKGVFVLNTKSFSVKYYLTDNRTSSLTILKDKVLLFGVGKWFFYDSDFGLKEIAPSGSYISFDGKSLQKNCLADTAYLVANPAGDYYKIIVKKDQVIISGRIQVQRFINTITIEKSNAWIHTKTTSFKEGSIDSILDLNLTDIESDKAGNIYSSSLTNGFAIKYNNTSYSIFTNFFLDKNDLITKIVTLKNRIVCGTQKGKILILSNGFIKMNEMTFPGLNVSIDYLKQLSDGVLIAGTSIGIFRIDLERKSIRLIDKILVIKDAIVKDDDVFFACTNGILKTSLKKLLEVDASFGKSLYYEKLKLGRSGAILLNPLDSNLIGSFNNGVFKWVGNKIIPLLYNGNPIYATALQTFNNKIIITTINQGIFMVEKNIIKNITTADGLISNSIKNVKISNSNIWLLYNENIQKLDHNFNVILTPEIPSNGIMIYDLVENVQGVFLTTNKGILKIDNNPKQSILSSTTIDFILINGKDTAINKSNFFNHQNNLQIHLSTPFFHSISTVRYKYKIYQGQETDWLLSEDHQKTFNLTALQPGTYFFEAVAINSTGMQIALPIKQVIIISPAYYQTILFKIGIILFCLLLSFLLYKNRVKQLLKVDAIRKKISSDLHDDIGSTLSSINIYTGLAKKHEKNGSYLEVITQNVTEVINKLDDLVWSINPTYDSAFSMTRRIESFAVTLAQGKDIDFNFDADQLSENKIPLEIKYSLFLILKELVNNAVKHSNCTNLNLHFKMDFTFLLIQVKDNGIGYDTNCTTCDRNGLINIVRRIESIKGASIIIDSVVGDGTTTTIKIPL